MVIDFFCREHLHWGVLTQMFPERASRDPQSICCRNADVCFGEEYYHGVSKQDFSGVSVGGGCVTLASGKWWILSTSLKKQLTALVEKIHICLWFGVFVDLDSFVRICIQVLKNNSYRKYLHQGCSMSFNFPWGQYFFSCQKLGSLFRVCRTFLPIFIILFTIL